MKSPCLSGYKKQYLYLRIVRGPGGLPSEAEEFCNFRVGRRLILSPFYYVSARSLKLTKGIVYILYKGSGAFPLKLKNFGIFKLATDQF